jgi:hypothetical protein
MDLLTLWVSVLCCSQSIFENTLKSNVMKIPLWETLLFRTDGHTDGRDESNSRLAQFYEFF